MSYDFKSDAIWHIELYVMRSCYVKEEFPERMEEIAKELKRRYLDKKTYCPALDDIRNLKLF